MESREDSEHAAATWIGKRDAGPWTPDDALALQRWLAESSGHRAAYYRLNAAWEEAGRLRALGAGTLAILAKTPLPRHSIGIRRRSARWALAASVLLALGVAWVLLQSAILHPDRYSTVIGGLQAVPMSDGSRVTLNTDSRLRISLNERERVVDLEHGEAFFEVARDTERPFVVTAGHTRVVAVGTQFSVLREGNEVRVIVSEGTVRMEPVNGDAPDAARPERDRLLLSAGTIARAQNENVLVQRKTAAQIEQSLTWRNGVLTFRDTPLADAVAEFNRYNTRKIVIADAAIADLQVGGIFRSTNLDPFVHLLEQGFPLRATSDGDRILLTSTAHD